MQHYISIEKNRNGGFEYFKTLWAERGITGIMATTMTEGIEKATEIENSKNDELYFIDIVADEFANYMAELRILSEETNAPILIVTSNYSTEEHRQATLNGASFYGGYCEPAENNIDAVINIVNNQWGRLQEVLGGVKFP